MSKVLVLNGPNLNRLGSREPEVYGSTTYSELVSSLTAVGVELGLVTDIKQTNDEAEMINWLQEALDERNDVVINPAAFTHYSYALRDAVSMLTSSGLRVIEVHISNP
ncbi:MAG: type II 3-dehydroquinate dehydratase, partial [Microbacteriaceae bacterium]|nr:type II 3-dehydroquinate dehydratase [Microbacteriaceae bacterium]